MENVGQSAQISSSAMQRKAIIAKVKASRLAKGKLEEETSSNEEPEYNFEKLKTFHIPRKKEQPEGKDLLTSLPLESREYTHTLYPAIKSSFLYPQSSRHICIQKVELVNNQTLLKEFLDKKKSMKDEGRTEKELSECFVFSHLLNVTEASKICENGLHIGNSSLISLGKPNLGAYVCKHADVVSASPLSATDSGCIVVFKLIKGKTKLVTESKGSTTNQEPTPLYDCHLTKWTGEGSKTNHSRAFHALQYYVYEYGELDIVNRPRQILPYAILHFTYIENDRIGQQRDSYQTLMDSSTLEIDQNSKYPVPIPGIGVRMFCLWKGKLLVKGGSFCNVEIRSENDAAVNKAFLDNNINVKMFLSVANFSRQLPATLLNKSGKKHNVVYRGRNYNIFTLVPADETGFGKFRQLIAHLVQEEAIAVVPLRMASCVYLIPNSNLTVNKMGLLPLSGNNDKPNTQFLHILVVTPKLLTTKINDQKIYNLVTVRKRRDPQGENKVPEELDQKLRSMNIESSSAAGTLPTEEHEKLLLVLKDKKRLQISEKFLHNHYKESITYFASKNSYQTFIETVKSLWSSSNQARLDYYKPKETKVTTSQPHKSILKPATSHDAKAFHPKPAKLPYLDVPVEGDAEATFSDEDDIGTENRGKSFASRPKLSINEPSVPKSISASEKRKLSLEVDLKSSPPIKMSRPSFKALVEIILTASVEELMLHPDFVFGERFDKTHRVTKEAGFSEVFDLEQERQISVEFRQQVPFLTSKDCPYAHEDNPVVKSMLRALYGTWDEDSDASPADLEKVNWVRDVLHRDKASSDSKHTVTSHVNDRTVSDDTTVSKDLSPFPPGSSSADSGFASSSTTNTPNAASQQTHSTSASSMQDIADMLVTALHGKLPEEATSALLEGNDAQATTQSIIQVLVKTLNESGKDIPSELKSIVDEYAAPPDKAPQGDVNASRESSPEPGVLSTSSSNGSPQMDPVVSNLSVDSLKHPDPISGHPQDPRLNKAHPSPRRLPLPSYRFPPSKKAVEQLPKDEEASRKFRLRAKFFNPSESLEQKKAGSTTPRKTATNRTGTDNQTSSYQGAIDLASIPGIAIKKKPRSSLTNKPIDPDLSNTGHRASVSATIAGTRSGSGNRIFDVGDYRTSIGTTSTESCATSPAIIHPTSTSGRRASFDPRMTPSGGKNIGEISTQELTGILRLLGIVPACDPAALPSTDTGSTPQKPRGILRGVQGQTHGQPEKAGTRGTKNTGQMVRVIDDKRILHDTDFGSAPLAFDKPSAILSNRLAASAARPNASERSGIKFFHENFKVVKPLATDDQRSISDHPPQSANDDKIGAPSSSDASKLPSTPDEAIENSSLDKAPSKQTTVNVCSSSKNVIPPVSTAAPALPENYIKQIHKKFKQQQKLRKKQGLMGNCASNQSEPAAAAADSDAEQQAVSELHRDPASTSVEADKSDKGPATVASSATTSTFASSSLPSSTVVVTASAIMTPSPEKASDETRTASPVTTDSSNLPLSSAEKAPAHPKEDIFSEINQVLQNVKSVRHGQQSTDALSTKLLQLAMQLRESSGNANDAAGQPVTTASQSSATTTSDPDPHFSVVATSEPQALQPISQSPSPVSLTVASTASEAAIPNVPEEPLPSVSPKPQASNMDTPKLAIETQNLPASVSSATEISKTSLPKLATETKAPLTSFSTISEVPKTDLEKPASKLEAPLTSFSISEVPKTDLEKPASKTQEPLTSFSISEEPRTDLEKPASKTQEPLTSFSISEVPKTDLEKPASKTQEPLTSFSISEVPKTDLEKPASKTQEPLTSTSTTTTFEFNSPISSTFGPGTDSRVISPKTPELKTESVTFEPGLPIPTIGGDKKLETTGIHASFDEQSQPIQVVEPQVRPTSAEDKTEIDYTRDTGTPTLDDTYNPYFTTKVKESYSKSYKFLKPLSRAALSKVVISDEIKQILKRIAESSRDKASDAEDQSARRTDVDRPATSKNVVTSSRDINQTPPPPSSDRITAQDAGICVEKTQKIAHVKPQPSTAGVQPRQSFYVFDPRDHPQCKRISAVLVQSGRSFQMHDIADAIASSVPPDDSVLVPVTRDMLDRALGDHTLWVVIRSEDFELMPVLPHLSLLKCAGPRVNFIQVDSAEEVHTKKYTNIMAGEFGIIMPVSVQVLLDNRVTFIGLLSWMLSLNKRKGNPYWRLALPKHILRQLKSYRDRNDVIPSLKSASVSLLDYIERHSHVVIDVTVTDDSSNDATTTEVFDAAIRLQMHYVAMTRHVVVLTENEESDRVWNTHRRVGIAVTTAEEFVKTILEEKMRDAQEDRIYSPLLKIYKVEK